jgi:lipopolysaccharide export system protein LptA
MYKLEDAEDVKKAEKKYGKLPEPPPPPPFRTEEDRNKSEVEFKEIEDNVVMKIETNVLNVYPGNRLKFSGNVVIESNGNKISSDMIDMKIDDIRLLIMDNVEISTPGVFENKDKRRYELTILKREQAMEKYGSKGINGALVLRTL